MRPILRGVSPHVLGLRLAAVPISLLTCGCASQSHNTNPYIDNPQGQEANPFAPNGTVGQTNRTSPSSETHGS
jgi:hypothetical protein